MESFLLARLFESGHLRNHGQVVRRLCAEEGTADIDLLGPASDESSIERLDIGLCVNARRSYLTMFWRDHCGVVSAFS